jgi:hypothetical protein
MNLERVVRSETAAVGSRAKPRARGGAFGPTGDGGLIPFRPGDSRVARALHDARRERGETLRMVAEGSGLPIRYCAAFESDAAALVFRSPEAAEPFLLEYARYLRVGIHALTARDDPAGAAVERGPPRTIPWSGRPPGKGGRPSTRGSGPTYRTGGRRSPMTIALIVVALVGIIGLSARMVAGALDVGGRARKGALTDRAGGARAAELPGGGRRLFPGHLVVALYGSPLTHRLGRLGLGPPSFAMQALRDQAQAYGGRRPVLPALEVVCTVAGRHPGPDGSYTHLLPEDVIQEYLGEARALQGLLIIDVQPGRRSFPDDMARYERFLAKPDVGLALDPEWRAGPGQVPGRQVGRVGAAEINAVIDRLAEIVRSHHLPQKLLVIHQFTSFMIQGRELLHTPPEVAVTFDIDGVGRREAKVTNYQDLANGPHGSFTGIKLYYTRDVGLMAPWEILALQPRPDLVIYQ